LIELPNETDRQNAFHRIASLASIQTMKRGAWGFLLTVIALCIVSFPELLTVRALAAGPSWGQWDPKQVKLIGSVVVSLLVGIFAMALILFKKDEADKKWAYAMLGTILGYWLPSPSQ
jgi:uncharacterized BrkB/YihY/UPF0761 family membrane protein